MARKRISMERIRKIIKLNQVSELGIRAIARAVNISRPAIQKYLDAFNKTGLKYNDMKEMPDKQLIELLEKYSSLKGASERFETLSKSFSYFYKELRRTGVTLQLLWKEYKKKHPSGYGYSQFCFHYAEFCKTNKLTMNIEHKAGDKMFADFTGKKMTIYDRKTGKGSDVEVFVAILGASGYTYAEAVSDQKKENWLKANDNALWFMQGVPAAIVPDCLKSGVTKADKYEPDINPEYDDFADHYGTTILPARPYHAQDKALVENAVKIVYMRVFAPLRNRIFYSLSELNEAIRELLDEHNNTKYQRLDFSRNELFEEVDKPALNTLPSQRYEMKGFKKLTVQFNYHIYLNEDKHYYSVPWKYKRKKVKLIYSSRTVEIIYNNIRIAFHQRDRNPYSRYSTKKEHMPPHHRFYDDWSPQKFINWACKKGIYVQKVIEKVLESCRHPEQGFKSCLGILNLDRQYKDNRLNMACKKAIYAGCHSLKRIKNILDNGLDKVLPPSQEENILPFHENIRGSEYYNKENVNG